MNRLVGIGLEKFEPAKTKGGQDQALIKVTVSNAGGSLNGAVIGACYLTYIARRQGDRWVIECTSNFDP
jgi:hypothetical protein